MDKIIVASNNEYKIREFKTMYNDKEVLSLAEIGFYDDIEETGKTFLENALIKAKVISEYALSKGYVCPIIADDSGLEVDALNGEPGVYSARYAGDHDDKKNRDYLLDRLKPFDNKNAHYTCCLVKYYPDGKYIHASAMTYGHMIETELGENGFGYDCIFYSHDLNKTFGEATSLEKNVISHRARALEKLKKLEENTIF